MDNDVTRILASIEQGDRDAASQLLPLVYEELRRLASQRMAKESPGHTLQPTALVHEAFLRLIGSPSDGRWDSRGHFFAAAAEAMRRILIDSARRRKSAKHGGKVVHRELSEVDVVADADDIDTLLAIDDSLKRLGEVDAQLARLVELRYFTGLTVEETAAALSVSPRTVKRDWAYARAWLKRDMEDRE